MKCLFRFSFKIMLCICFRNIYKILKNQKTDGVNLEYLQVLPFNYLLCPKQLKRHIFQHLLVWAPEISAREDEGKGKLHKTIVIGLKFRRNNSHKNFS